MENGVNPRAIQKAMGHSSLETTMGYLHAESLSVHSPLESVLGGKLQRPFQNLSIPNQK
jgi:integrase